MDDDDDNGKFLKFQTLQP